MVYVIGTDDDVQVYQFLPTSGTPTQAIGHIMNEAVTYLNNVMDITGFQVDKSGRIIISGTRVDPRYSYVEPLQSLYQSVLLTYRNFTADNVNAIPAATFFGCFSNESYFTEKMGYVNGPQAVNFRYMHEEASRLNYT